jgi:hypothetical protein
MTTREGANVQVAVCPRFASVGFLTGFTSAFASCISDRLWFWHFGISTTLPAPALHLKSRQLRQSGSGSWTRDQRQSRPETRDQNAERSAVKREHQVLNLNQSGYGRVCQVRGQPHVCIPCACACASNEIKAEQKTEAASGETRGTPSSRDEGAEGRGERGARAPPKKKGAEYSAGVGVGP